MLTDHFFQQPKHPDVFAATIGVSRQGWISARATAKRAEASLLMQQNRFDILPVTENDESIQRYYHTRIWGDYEKIDRSKITQDDSIYYLTHIRDVIRLMARHEKWFYFLNNESRVLGLITIGNLNARSVYLYLYHNLLLLETELGKWVQLYLKDEPVFSVLESLSVGANEHGGLLQYREDKENGLDNDILEYLFLGDLFEIVRRKGLFEYLGYTSSERFDQHLSKLRQMRNTVAHPNRSLVHDANTLQELWLSITKLEELFDRIGSANNAKIN